MSLILPALRGIPGSVTSSGSGMPASITAVATDGWQATSATTLTALQPNIDVPVTRQGYDGSYTSPGGVPTPTLKSNISETFQLRHRIRNIYPDDLSEPIWSETEAALSDWVYSTDIVAGATNSSTESSPKPTCGWAVTDRRVVGDSLNVQVVAFHRNARNGQQCAMAVFSATDGTNTIYQAVTTTSILSHPGGSHPIAGIRIEGFEATLDLSSLVAANPGDITVNCKIYPWIGGVASVADSSLGTSVNEFSPLVFRRDTSKATNPPLVYVSNAGTDATVLASGATSTGIQKVSTDAATARANPFASIQSALAALKLATNVTGGWTDGCEIRIMDAVAIGSTSTAAYTYQQSACVTITRDPLVTRTNAALTISANNNFRQPYLRIADVTWNRSGLFGVSGTGSQKVFWENITFNSNNHNSAPHATYTGYFTGCAINGAASGFWSAGGTTMALIRSCTVVSGSSRPEAGMCIGNYLIHDCYPKALSARNTVRSIVGFNKIMNYGYTSSASPWDYTIENPVFCQNVMEGVDKDNPATGFNFCNDSATYTLPGLILMNNTFAGAWQRYRSNFLYDDTIGTYRYHRLVRVAGNVMSQVTTKTDWFVGNNSSGNSAETLQHNKGQTVLYGVGIDEIHCLWPDAEATGYGQDSLERRWGNYCSYTLGRNSSRPNGVSGFIEFLNDAGFKNNGSVTYAPGSTKGTGTYTSGIGNGDYRPKRISQGDASDSPLLGKIASSYFRYDIAGNARTAINDTIGAYA